MVDLSVPWCTIHLRDSSYLFLMFMLTFIWIIVGESGRDIRIGDFLPPNMLNSF